MLKSSPRAWGCFWVSDGTTRGQYVFPTCVGVFPVEWAMPGLMRGLPHVRGGVSTYYALPFRFILSSPRAWGCFQGLLLTAF